PCANIAGACCLSSGVCQLALRAECDTLGGTFQGGDMECVPLLCPVSNPCDSEHGDVVYENIQWDMVSAFTSQDSREIGGIESYPADDSTLADDITITGFHWYDTAEDNTTTNGTADFILVRDNGGTPRGGEVLYEMDHVANVRIDVGPHVYRVPE